MKKFRRVWAAGLLLAGLGGCSSDNEPAAVVTPAGAVVTTNTALASEEWMWTAADPFDPFVPALTAGATASDAASAATTLVSKLDNYYTPAGCATGTTSGGAATITLQNCTGPLGGMGLTGTVIVTYAAATNAVAINITSKDLKGDSGSINLDIVGNYTESGDQRQITFTDTSSATGDDGTTVGRNTTSTASWTKGTRDVKVDSTGQVSLNGQSVDLTSNRTLSGSRCATGTTTLSTSKNSASLTLNGGSDATFTDSKGNTQTVGLACGL